MKDQDKKIETIERLMLSDKSVNAPADSVKWAKNIFRSRAAQPKGSLVRSLRAILQLDLTPGKAAFGERSAAKSVRQMLFDAGENSVDIRLSPAGGEFELTGQVLGDGFENCAVELTGTQSTFTGTLNDSAEFRLAGIPSDTYRLSLRKDELEIVIEGLEIK